MPPIERIGQSRRETENHLQVSAIAFKLETEKSSSLFAGRVGKFVQKNIFQLKLCLWLTSINIAREKKGQVNAANSWWY
jgi:hypothetical protein